MGHGKATFKQADLTRALRAVEKAGCDVVRAEIARDGRIVLVFKNGEEVLVERNECDDGTHKAEIRQRLREPGS